MQLDSSGNDNKQVLLEQARSRTNNSGSSKETEPGLAYREQAISAKGTAVVLATITKRVQQQKGCESLKAWGRVARGGGQRKEASLLMVNIPQMS